MRIRSLILPEAFSDQILHIEFCFQLGTLLPQVIVLIIHDLKLVTQSPNFCLQSRDQALCLFMVYYRFIFWQLLPQLRNAAIVETKWSVFVQAIEEFSYWSGFRTCFLSNEHPAFNFLICCHLISSCQSDVLNVEQQSLHFLLKTFQKYFTFALEKMSHV